MTQLRGRQGQWGLSALGIMMLPLVWRLWRLGRYDGESLVLVVVAVMVTLSLYLILLPLADTRVGRPLISLLGLLLSTYYLVIMFALVVTTPLLTMAFSVGIPWLVLEALSRVSGLEAFLPPTTKAYFALLTATVVFAYWGPNAVELFARTGMSGRKTYQKIVITKSRAIVGALPFRAIAYGLVIVLTMAATVEELSGQSISAAPLWSSVSTVAHKVLITFVAIESLLGNRARHGHATRRDADESEGLGA